MRGRTLALRIRGQDAEGAKVAQKAQKEYQKGFGLGQELVPPITKHRRKPESANPPPSFPRRRESTTALLMAMDSRLRGNDGILRFFLHAKINRRFLR